MNRIWNSTVDTLTTPSFITSIYSTIPFIITPFAYGEAIFFIPAT